jgi:hypothetical protein
MKTKVVLGSVTFAVIVFLGGMLATPILKINRGSQNPTVADGGPPLPPPPFSA